jgi:hypothetical protein
MRIAEQIAEIAQSEFVWNLYVESELFSHRGLSGEVLSEARSILHIKLKLSANCLTECERTEKALQRLEIFGPSFILH